MTQAIVEVRALVDEITQAFWTDDQLTSWINQGCEDVASRAETNWNEVDINVTAGVQTYAFPTDFLNAHRAQFTIGGTNQGSQQTLNLTYRRMNAMDENWGILQNLPNSWPNFFTIRGNRPRGVFLMLWPAPGAPGVLTVFYYRQAQPVTVASGDNIDMAPGWERIVFDYAVYKAFRASKDPTWQDAFKLYETNLQEMISKTRDYTDLPDVVTSENINWMSWMWGADSY